MSARAMKKARPHSASRATKTVKRSSRCWNNPLLAPFPIQAVRAHNTKNALVEEAGRVEESVDGLCGGARADRHRRGWRPDPGAAGSCGQAGCGRKVNACSARREHSQGTAQESLQGR